MRAEEAATDPELAGRAAVAISRALRLDVFLALAVPLLAPHGTAIAMPTPRTAGLARRRGLEAALALQGHPTLLVDLDPQGSATTGVGVRPADGEETIYEALLGGRAMKDIVRPTAIERLAVAPATRDLVGAEVELVPQLARENRLNEALASVRTRYDFILIDCPPSLSLLTVNALRAADSVLVPLQCEYYALEGLT